MLYLLDANTLIDAKRDYYPIDSIPEFWEWLIYMGQSGNVKMPLENYEEILDKKNKSGDQDRLSVWASDKNVKDSLVLKEEVETDLVARVTYGGYVPNPTDEELSKLGRDPFLIAYALKDPANRVVVSTEVSAIGKKGANRRVPDVCANFSIKCINNFQLIKELNFSTRWKSQLNNAM